ncbi:MAG: NAD-dependent epimerase/dehydratase family protein [candidate division Zixibacteria bacterium]|nr:NAD-dependent epimerase/dehydratase family protein [candidate division Zixibacteria bacterium]
MPNDTQTVLITGANGFVGSRLCRRLMADGFRVIAGVREGCNTDRLRGIEPEYRYGDITRPETLAGLIAGVDYIVHNAGVVKVNRPETFFTVNRDGTENLLKAASTCTTLKKLVYISSLAAAGPSENGRPLTEDDEPHPITAYGRSKLAGEEVVQKYKDAVNSVIVRPPGIYGPGDKEMYAFFQIVNNRIAPYLGRLSRKLQLVYVDDLADGVSKALGANTQSGRVYFIAEDKGYSFRELVGHLRGAVDRFCLPLYVPGFILKIIAWLSEHIMSIFGKTPMFTVEKANEILADWEVDVSRAREELGFESQIPFPEGARETVYWYREEAWL